MNKITLASITAGIIGLSLATLSLKANIAVGDMAPDFTLNSDSDQTYTLSALRGKKIALYFYPKDETPGCTAQACSLRDKFADLEKEGITILGINSDSVSLHQKFKKNHSLSFPLLSDEGNKVAKQYGAIGFFGKIIGMTSRMTFLIDESGKIAKIITSIDVKNHADQIIREFKK